jgi:hypothetical protein
MILSKLGLMHLRDEQGMAAPPPLRDDAGLPEPLGRGLSDRPLSPSPVVVHNDSDQLTPMSVTSERMPGPPAREHVGAPPMPSAILSRTEPSVPPHLPNPRGSLSSQAVRDTSSLLSLLGDPPAARASIAQQLPRKCASNTVPALTVPNAAPKDDLLSLFDDDFSQPLAPAPTPASPMLQPQTLHSQGSRNASSSTVPTPSTRHSGLLAKFAAPSHFASSSLANTHPPASNLQDAAAAAPTTARKRKAFQVDGENE